MKRDRRTRRRRLVAGALVLAAAALAFVISVVAIDGRPFSHPTRVDAIVPANAPIVRPGDEVRIAGQPVGQVRSVSLDPAGRRVEMEIGDRTIGRDASATVRLRGLAGAVFIELDPGDVASDQAASGFTIGRSHTATGTQLTDVVAAFDASARRDLGRTLTAYGLGMAGRGTDLNATLADLPVALRQGAPLLRGLEPAPGALSATVSDLDAVLRGLRGSAPGTLADLIAGARQTLDAAAASNDELAGAIAQAPGLEGQVDATTPVADRLLHDARATATDLSPAAATLAADLPRINGLLGRTDEVSQLVEIARSAQPTLRAAGPALAGMQPAAATLGPLAGAIEPLAAYVARYPQDVLAGPTGFTTWGRFAYEQGQASGHRAVRFTPVFTCIAGRDPYPRPGRASADRKAC